MKNWGSIQRGSTLIETDKPGCVLATNSRFFFRGEIRRRKGMSRTNIPQYSATVVGVCPFTRIPGEPGIAVILDDGSGEGGGGATGPIFGPGVGPGVGPGGGDNPSRDPAPSIRVTRGAQVIANGAHDSIGAITYNVAHALSYTILNGGTADLLLNGASFAGETNCTVAITAGPAATVAAGASTTFNVTVTPTGSAEWDFSMMVNNNVIGESPYTWQPFGDMAPVPPDCDTVWNALGTSTALEVMLPILQPPATRLWSIYKVSHTCNSGGVGAIGCTGSAGTWANLVGTSHFIINMTDGAEPVEVTIAINKATGACDIRATAHSVKWSKDGVTNLMDMSGKLNGAVVLDFMGTCAYPGGDSSNTLTVTFVSA